MILQTARDIDVAGTDRYTGYGMLDARAALAASPSFFLDVSIDNVQVAQKGKKTVLQVLGTVDADRLKKAWVEIGEGEEPGKWKKASSDVKKAIKEGIITDLDAAQFRSSLTWTLRLIAEHKNGTKRESRFVLKLG